MSMLRLNLHIKSEVYPELVELLEKQSGKTRAEMMRKLASFGLRELRSRRSKPEDKGHDRTEMSKEMAEMNDESSEDNDFFPGFNLMLKGMSL